MFDLGLCFKYPLRFSVLRFVIYHSSDVIMRFHQCMLVKVYNISVIAIIRHVLHKHLSLQCWLKKQKDPAVPPRTPPPLHANPAANLTAKPTTLRTSTSANPPPPNFDLYTHTTLRTPTPVKHTTPRNPTPEPPRTDPPARQRESK